MWGHRCTLEAYEGNGTWMCFVKKFINAFLSFLTTTCGCEVHPNTNTWYPFTLNFISLAKSFLIRPQGSSKLYC